MKDSSESGVFENCIGVLQFTSSLIDSATVIIESEKCHQCNRKISNKFVQDGWNIFHKKCYKQFKTQNTGMTCFKCGEKTLEWVMFQGNGLRCFRKSMAYHLVQSSADTRSPSSDLNINCAYPDHDKAKHCTKTVSHALFAKKLSKVNIWSETNTHTTKIAFQKHSGKSVTNVESTPSSG